MARIRPLAAFEGHKLCDQIGLTLHSQARADRPAHEALAMAAGAGPLQGRFVVQITGHHFCPQGSQGTAGRLGGIAGQGTHGKTAL